VLNGWVLDVVPEPDVVEDPVGSVIVPFVPLKVAKLVMVEVKIVDPEVPVVVEVITVTLPLNVELLCPPEVEDDPAEGEVQLAVKIAY